MMGACDNSSPKYSFLAGISDCNKGVSETHKCDSLHINKLSSSLLQPSHKHLLTKKYMDFLPQIVYFAQNIHKNSRFSN